MWFIVRQACDGAREMGSRLSRVDDGRCAAHVSLVTFGRTTANTPRVTAEGNHARAGETESPTAPRDAQGVAVAGR